MNKERWNEFLPKLREKLSFLRPWDLEDDDVGADMEVREVRTSDGKDGWSGEENDPERSRRGRRLIIGSIALAAVVICVFLYYNGHHTFTDYVITSTVESLDISGTKYISLGNNIVKYSPDGAFCVNNRNEAKWSVAYSMQAPIVEICEETMVIAEQQGQQVYVMDKNGLAGHFETDLPILKAHVSRQGVVVLILEDDDVTLVEMYDSSGSEIARIKTTLQDSGYPLDVAITPNASRMMISFLEVTKGKLGSRIAFYDFSSAAASDESHLTGELEYTGKVFPEVYYADASTPVALSNDGFVVFKNKKEPQEDSAVTFEKEIISSFHDSDYVGFVFASETPDCRYEMELYRYNGRRMMQEEFDCNYTEVKMDRGEILLYDAKDCTVFTTSGVQRFASDYEKQVEYFAKIAGFRKYLVITNESMDHLRIH